MSKVSLKLIGMKNTDGIKVTLRKRFKQFDIPKPRKSAKVLTPIVIVLISLFTGIWAFHESPRYLLSNRVPLGGDGTSTGFYIRLVLEGSWLDVFTQHIRSGQFGWPGEIDYTNYPSGNLLEILVIKAFSVLTGITEPSNLIHFFAVTKIVPITLTSYIMFRFFNASKVLSFLGAIAFATSSFNLIRAEGHFFLGFTWTIPVTVTLLFLAFKISLIEDEVTQKEKLNFNQLVKFFLPAVVIGLSSFYFAIISIILTLFFLSIITISGIIIILRNRQISQDYFRLFKDVIRKISGFFVIFIGICVGLVTQLGPILIRSHRLPSLSGIADRSWTESIVYSGSIESFFFDGVALFLKVIGRPEILNFTSTRISWEGSQLGALAGVVAVGCIFLLFFQLCHKVWFTNLQNSPSIISIYFRDTRLKFLTLLTFFALILYLPSPINFGISQILPQIRAWGRVSVFLTLCMIAILVVGIGMLRKHSFTVGVLICTLFIIPFTETLEFRKSRPAGIDISRAAIDASTLRGTTLATMRNSLEKNCAIFQIPIYPYPGFDIPNDNAGDYAGISLPSEDYGYFRWSSPAIKDTYAWKALQPLVSQSPNFARVTLSFSIEYGSALGACAALIDRAQLTMPESLELNELLDVSNCYANLDGEKFGNSSRFVLYHLKQRCSTIVSKEVALFAKNNLMGDYLWKVDQAFGIEFLNEFQMFLTNSAINTRVISGSNLVQTPTYYWRFRFLPDKESGRLKEVIICKRNLSTNTNSCSSRPIDANGYTTISPNMEDLRPGLQKFEFTLPEGASEQLVRKNWGVVLLQE